MEKHGPGNVLRTWWRAPKLRIQCSAEEERHATWMELFFDLVFAATIAQLSSMLTANVVDLQVVLGFVGLFIPVWWAWVGVAFYDNRFDPDDLGNRLLMLFQMMAAAAMAINIHQGPEANAIGFALSYGVIRVLLVLQYLRARRHIPAARKLTARYIGGFGAAACLWFLSIFIEPPQRYWIWGVAMVVDIGGPLTAGRLHAEIPPHVSHITERFGLFTLIVLGDSIFNVINGLARLDWNVVSGCAAGLGMVLFFGIWWLYFNNLDDSAIRNLKHNRKRVGHYQWWLYLHLPLFIGIAAAGAGIENTLVGSAGSSHGHLNGFLLNGALGCVILSIAGLQQVTHSANAYFCGRMWMVYGMAALMVTLFPFAPEPFRSLLALISFDTLIFILLVLFDLWAESIGCTAAMRDGQEGECH